NIINLMSKVCDWAMVNAFITKNWVREAQLVRPQRPKLSLADEDAKFLDLDEIALLSEFCRTDGANTTAKAIIALGLMAGLRRGEIAAIQWGAIGWDSNTLRVTQAISDGKISTETKSTASRATINVPATFLRILQEHHDAMKAAGRSVARDAYVVTRDTPRKSGPAGAGKNTAALPAGVFHPDELNDFWDEHIKPLGLKPTSTPHAMRHSYASVLIQEQGHNLKFIQSQMRHASFHITMGTYGHLFKTNNPEAMRSLDAFFAPKVVAGRFTATAHR
ncbi:MAG: site-specific integrase, partial [Acidobacteria bacterium]